MPEPTTILLISGSTRQRSTNTPALRPAAVLAPPGIRAVLCDGLADLPAFSPDAPDDRPHPAVADLRQRLTEADAVVFCTPEYAGTLPGSLKNLLDWTVGTGELHGKPVAWVNVAGPDRGEGATATLALVLRYVAASVIAPACLRVPIPRDAVGPDGLVTPPALRDALAELWRQLLRHPPARARCR